jgi:hypothetical protein
MEPEDSLQYSQEPVPCQIMQYMSEVACNIAQSSNSFGKALLFPLAPDKIPRLCSTIIQSRANDSHN